MFSQIRRLTSFIDSGEGGTLAWVNPSNVGASDNQYATVSFPNAGVSVSNWLHCTVAGPTPLSIPSDATGITITLAIEGHASQAAVMNYEALMLIGGIREVDFIGQGLWASSDEIKTHPPVSDVLLTPAVINNPANGIAFQFQSTNLDGLSTVIASLDDMIITVDYESSSEDHASLSPTVFAAMPANKAHLILPNNKSHLTILDQR